MGSGPGGPFVLGEALLGGAGGLAAAEEGGEEEPLGLDEVLRGTGATDRAFAAATLRQMDGDVASAIEARSGHR